MALKLSKDEWEHAENIPALRKRVVDLQNEVIKLEAWCLNAAACLSKQADVLKSAAAEANRVSDPRQK